MKCILFSSFFPLQYYCCSSVFRIHSAWFYGIWFYFVTLFFMISTWLFIRQIMSWAFEKKSVRVFHLSFLTKSPQTLYLRKERHRTERGQEAEPPFCLCSAFWSRDFLRGETSQTTHAVRLSKPIFMLLQFPQGGPPDVLPQKHRDPDSIILINRWTKCPLGEEGFPWSPSVPAGPQVTSVPSECSVALSPAGFWFPLKSIYEQRGSNVASYEP